MKTELLIKDLQEKIELIDFLFNDGKLSEKEKIEFKGSRDAYECILKNIQDEYYN